MLDNLKARGCQLTGVVACKDKESQVAMGMGTVMIVFMRNLSLVCNYRIMLTDECITTRRWVDLQTLDGILLNAGI